VLGTQTDLLRATIDSEQDGVFIVRLRDEDPLSPPVLYANPAFSRITGYANGDLRGGVYPRLFGELTNLTLVTEQVKAILRGQPVEVEVELYRKDGTRFWAEVRAHPLESPTVHCALSIHDITARRLSQEIMQFLTEAISQASDFVIVAETQPAGEGGPRILYANRAYLDATGFEASEVIGKPRSLIYSETNAAPVMAAIRDAVECSRENFREVLARRRDGSDFWIEFTDRPFTTHTGRELRLLVGRDITVRRRSTNQLSLLYLAAEQATTPIVIYDVEADGELEVSYENAIAASRNYYHLPAVLSRTGGGELRQRLDRGEVVELEYDRNGEHVRLYARAIRNASRLETVLTQERLL
jgi:PAS domain S-box-containing protein